MRYIDELIRLKCASDMLYFGLFPNAKEITESFGAYSAIRDHCPWAFDDSSVTVLCVGDGHTPRTAATFAFRSHWNCISVDPVLRLKIKYRMITRLKCLKQKVEDIEPIISDKIIIVAVHSHAKLQDALDRCVCKEAFIVAIPCCFPQELDDREPDISYVDESILSPKNTVLCWRI